MADVGTINELFAWIEKFQPWAKLGACRNEDPEALFVSGSRQNEIVAQLCTNCVVRRECLSFALDTQQEFGVWGATERTRRKMLKRHPHITNWARVFGVTHTPERLTRSA